MDQELGIIERNNTLTIRYSVELMYVKGSCFKTAPWMYYSL